MLTKEAATLALKNLRIQGRKRFVLQDSYYRAILLLGATIVVVIGILTAILLHSGPRVRLFSFDADARLSNGHTMTVTFDRPLDARDYTSAIHFEPSVDISVKTQGKSIYITLKTNLQQSTNYTLTVSPDIYDNNGRRMQAEYSHSFMTGKAQYLFVQRNYTVNLADGSDADDKVLLGDLHGKLETIFSAQRIRLMRANDRFVIVAVDEGNSDAIVSIDLKSRKVRKESLYVQGRVRELTISPMGSVVLYTIEPEFNGDDPEFFSTYAYQLHALDLKSGHGYAVTETKNENEGESTGAEPLRAEIVTFNSDGQYALIKNTAGSFMIVSPFNDYEPVLLGAHTRSYGFDAAGEHIIFEDEGVITTYRLQDAQKKERPVNKIVLDISATKGALFIQTADYEVSKFISKLYRMENWEDDPKAVWESDDQKVILRAFSESYDQRYIALQKMPSDCRYDDYQTASECQDSYIDIYDPNTNQVVQHLMGIGLVWLP